MDKLRKVVVVGSLNMDSVIKVPHIPLSGETIMAEKVQKFCGGKGANQAVALGKLNGNVYSIGRIGRDSDGKELEESLKSNNVNTDGLTSDKDSPTGNAYIYVSSQGDNNIVVNAGANEKLDIRQLNQFEFLLEDAVYCISQLEIPLETVEYLAKYCIKNGIKFILNPSPAKSLNHDTFKGSYIIIPNELELEELVSEGNTIEDKAEFLLKKGYENVLVTLGDKGSFLLNNQIKKYFPIYEGFKTVDTTGAGDSFVGGLVCKLSEGKTIEEAIPYAALVAAITVSRSGAQSSLPGRELVDSYWQQ